MAFKSCKDCGNEISNNVKKCIKCGKDQRNFFAKHKIITFILVLIVIGIIGSIGNEDKDTRISKTDSVVIKTTTSLNQTETPNHTMHISTPTKEVIPTPTPTPIEIELSNGNYVAGIDFPAGIYDIIAIKGGGNVISSNAYQGGLNAIMGIDESDNFYQKEYKNIKLPNKTELKISRVTVVLKYK